MKIKIVGNWELLLVPETNAEQKILEQTNALGHVHFVCKAFGRLSPRQKRAGLLLTPSLIRWQRPPEPKRNRKLADRQSAIKGDSNG